MRRNADPMAILFLEDFSESNKGLDVAARSNNLNDDIEPRWRLLAGFASETREGVYWWPCRLDRNSYLVGDTWRKKLSKPVVLGVDVDVDSSVAWGAKVSRSIPSSRRTKQGYLMPMATLIAAQCGVEKR